MAHEDSRVTIDEETRVRKDVQHIEVAGPACSQLSLVGDGVMNEQHSREEACFG